MVHDSVSSLAIAMGFLDGQRGVVVLITCGASQCTAPDDATSLAKTVYDRVKQLLPAGGTNKP